MVLCKYQCNLAYLARNWQEPRDVTARPLKIAPQNTTRLTERECVAWEHVYETSAKLGIGCDINQYWFFVESRIN